jgi:hypothetical protein
MNTLDDADGVGGIDLFCDICTEERGVNLETLEQTLRQSTCLILDPLQGHPHEQKHLDDPNMRETIKELAQLDGAFLISDDGIVLSAARYINASANGIDLPLGLGSRHVAAASITKHTNAIAVVVSESSVVRVLDDGDIVSEIIPELWLFRRHGLHRKGPHSTRTSQEMTIASKKGTVQESQ